MSAVDDNHEPASAFVPAFIPALELNGYFYAEVVAPLLAEAFPRLRYSAALIGYGSELLGYDTARSTDHNWGPRLLLFLAEENLAAHAAAIDELFRTRLPATFRGYSTHFDQPGPDGARLLGAGECGRIDHKIEIYAPRPLLRDWLGADPFGDLSAVDWLLMPQQKLLEVTAGRVYHDGLGELEPVRAMLAWYPHDVWLYLLAAQWQRISQQEAFVGRAGEVGDELGSALVAADLVRELMRLCFLMERRYAPYSKWFGTAFAELASAPSLLPRFRRVLQAASWREREAELAPVYVRLAEMQNALGVAEWVDPSTRPYYTRPYQVLHAERFVATFTAAITDPEVCAIIDRAGLVGGIDQVSDNVDAKSQHPKLRALYD